MKKHNYFTALVFMIALIISISLVSCDGDDDNDADSNLSESQLRDLRITEQLKGTNWKLIDEKIGGKSVNYLETGIVGFGTELYTFDDTYELFINGERVGYWYINDEEVRTNLTDVEAFYKGYYWGQFGLKMGTPIVTLSDSRLVIGDLDGDAWYYNRDYSNSPGGGGNSSNIAPEFYNFTYSTTQNSITVNFYTDPKASSATVYYGENSPSKSVSATIANKQITAKITGLKKATKYYIKCTAKNSYGSTTSDTFTLMTN